MQLLFLKGSSYDKERSEVETIVVSYANAVYFMFMKFFQHKSFVTFAH